VKVVPLANEGALRNRDWVEGNLKKVTEATGGRVAYVYVPNTADAGAHLLQALLLPAGHREAIIVDERFNGGGSGGRLLHRHPAPPYISLLGDALRRRPPTPIAAILGPKVMLIDETAGSGGDLLPWMFRKFGWGRWSASAPGAGWSASSASRC
jgi:tricorn protease